MSEEKTKKKGSWFKNLLFEQVDETAETVEEAVDITVSNTGGNFSTPTENLNVPTSGDGVFDNKFNESLQALMAENNIPGVDYFEFREAIKQMSAVAGLSEAASFQTAFTTLKVGDPSFTKEKLMSSIDHYDKVFSQEESEFNSELQTQTDSEVNSRRSRAESLNAENQDLVQQIQNLNEQIQRNQDEAIKLNSEASMAEANISQTSKNFIKTLTHVRAKLDTDKQKITELIKE
jgi:alpha-L-fucosidase